ncbi:DUF3895 domain-containing protein [Pseudalkalibacillus caeni]|uniref:DUF3895 domain-containing protein n=1 Tax=Exobacillus caeni TaxID=2574798 RepID=A0A5R9F7K9_9BACL|nr:DUF3895 domain-containing protein [Pseudalkalibacillus caeni]TLS36494.1 DUF3895 domain-containing protein [Pseudalkalibacillus caeni]
MLSYKEKELVKDYLQRHNSFKLKELCNYLIDNGSSKETYSSGKLKIYPYAAIYIKSFIPDIAIRELENEDLFYEIKGELPVETEDVENEKSNEPDEDEVADESGQLSLF